MGAASSIDASRVQEMSEAELSAARRGVEQHVSRLEAENQALKARLAELEAAGPTQPQMRRNQSAEESTSSLPAELQGLDALSASIAAPEALAERSRAAAESPDDEAARRALAESVEEAMNDVRDAFASQAGRPGVVTMCDAAIAAGDKDFRDVYEVMWDRIARGHAEDLAAYETAVASVRRRSLTAVTQGTESIAELVAAAGRVKARFDEHMSSLGGSIKGARCSLPDKLKRTSRIVEKTFCQGTCSRIFDVVRCMIVVDDMSIAAAALSRLATDSEVEIVRIKELLSGSPRAAAGAIV